jgi:ParB-like chromosome segregation protein Spo0J
VIGRPVGRRYQLAFGHHRIEAARRTGVAEMQLLVEDMDDRQMLQLMGRENGEDYSANFLVMLST